MQKKLIALAVAGLASTAAFAQVTVYGIADAGFAQVSGKTTTDGVVTAKNKTQGINAGHLSGSRIGFDASEDLGGGMTGFAKFEVAVNLDNGNDATATAVGTTAACDTTTDCGSGVGVVPAHTHTVTVTRTGALGQMRQGYVGLRSAAVGEVRFGRQYSAASAASTTFDVTAGSPLYSTQAGAATAAGAEIRSGGVRQDNTMAYVSPNISGFVGSVSYTFGEQNTADPDGAGAGEAGSAFKALSASGVYSAGPLAAGVMLTNQSDVGGTLAGANARDISDLGVGASYDLGMVKLAGMYQTVQDETATVSETEGTVMSLGANVPIGANSVQLTYATGDTEVTTAAGVKTNERDITFFGATYRHALGKRTTAHAGLVKSTTKDTVIATTVATKVTSTTIALGLRHTF